jgi:hypothetical protein
MNGDLYFGQPSTTRRQRALVIAVGRFDNYKEFSLKGVYHDLEAWSSFLRAHRFEVTELRDPTLPQMKQAVQALRVAELGEGTPHFVRVGVLRNGDTSAEAEAIERPPGDTLALIYYAGLGFLAGAKRFVAGSDLVVSGGKEPQDSMARSAFAVDDLERQARVQAAASVLVYDTQFL